MTQGIEETARGGSQGGRARWGVLAALVIYVALALLVTFPLCLRLSSSLARKYVDGALPFGDVNCFLWSFWWVKKALVEHHASLLFTPYQAFPHGLDLTFTTLVFLNGFFSLVLQPLFSLIGIYNLFFLASLTLAAFFTFLLVRECGGDWWGALLAGVLFSYSQFFFFHYAHLNLLSIFWVPLTLVFVARLIRTKKVIYAPLAALGVAATALSDWYILVYLMVLLALWLGYGLWSSERGEMTRRERLARRIVVAAVVLCFVASSFTIVAVYCIPVPFFIYLVFSLYRRRAQGEANVHTRNVALFVVCSVIFLLPYGYPVLTRYVRAMDVVQVPLESKIYFSAEPLSFVVPHRGWEWLWRMPPRRAEIAYGAQFPGELEHFFGIVGVVLLVLLLCVAGRQTRWRFWLFAAGVFALLALGPVVKWFGAIQVKSLPYGVIVLPGAIFHRLFITEGMRVYARFGIMALLSLSVFVGCNLGVLRERFKLGRRTYQMAAALLCIVALAEKISVPMQLARIDVPPVFSALRSLSPGRAILSFPFSHDSTYLYLQTIHEHPIVNSYVSRGDEETRRFYKSLYLMNLLSTSDTPVLPLDMAPEELRQRLREEREHLRIDFFIVHTQYLTREAIAAMRAFFGDFLGIPVAFEDGSVVIFSEQGLPRLRRIAPWGQ